MTFAHKVSLLEVLQETASEEALVLVNNEIKRRNFGGLYLKEFQANLPDTIFNTNVQRIVNDAALLTASLKNQTAGHVFAAPEVANGTPGFRALKLADISDYNSPASLNYWTKNEVTSTLSTLNRVVIGSGVDNGVDDLQVVGNATIGNAKIHQTGSASNLFFGQLVGLSSTGANNTAIGMESLVGNTSGNYHTVVGFGALRSNTTGTRNVAIGYNSQLYGQTAFNNTTVGMHVMLGNATNRQTGSHNTGVGYEAIRDLEGAAANNTAFGALAMQLAIDQNYAVAVGRNTMANNNKQYYNIAIGTSTLLYGRTSSIGVNAFNIGIGISALQGSSTNDNTHIFNTAIGAYSQQLIETGRDNISIGYYSSRNNVSGNNNIAFGSYGLEQNLNTGNIGIGHSVARFGQHTASTYVGFAAGLGVNGSTNLNHSNTGVGYNVLYNINGATYNTAIGRNSGLLLVTGNQNLFLGYNSGSAVASGSHNVLIGGSTGGRINGLSNWMIFSDGLANERFSVAPTGNFLVNTPIDNAVDKLQVNGSIYTTGVKSVNRNIDITNTTYPTNFKTLSFGATNIGASTGFKFSWRNDTSTPRIDALIFDRNGQIYLLNNTIIGTTIDNGVDKLQVVGSGYFSTRLGVGLSNTDSGIAYAKAGNLLIINHLEQGSNYYDATTHTFRGLNAGVTTLDVFGAVKSRTGRFEVNHEDKTGLWAYDVNGEVGFLGKANSAVGGVIMSNSVTNKAIHVSNDGHAYYNYKRILLEGDITNGATNPGLDAVVSVSHYVNNRTVDYWVNASATFQTVKSANGAALKAELFWQDANASGNGMEQLSKIGFRHSASGFSVAAASDSSLLLSKDTFFAKLKITSSYSALQFLDSADVISSVLLHNSTGISLNAQNAKFGVGSANGGSAKAFYAAGISEITLGEDRLNDDPSTPIGLGIKLRYNNKFRGGIWYDNTPAVGILKFGTNLSGAIGNNEIDVEFNSGRSLFILATHDLEIKANLNHATDGFVKKLKIGHVSALDILEINGTKINFFRGTTPTNGQRFELVSDATGTLYLNPIN